MEINTKDKQYSNMTNFVRRFALELNAERADTLMRLYQAIDEKIKGESCEFTPIIKTKPNSKLNFPRKAF